MDRSRPRAAAAAIVVGGTVAAVTFLPFTLAHGPTSYNLEREVLGWDMHRWGLLLGTVPEILIGWGLWRLRGLIAGGRRVPVGALTVLCVVMWLFAAMNLAFRAIGPPLDLFVLAPASVLAASTTAARGPIRTVLAALAAAYCAALAFGMIPSETSDRIDGYRVFGLIDHAGVGLLWTVLGAVLLRARWVPRRDRRSPVPPDGEQYRESLRAIPVGEDPAQRRWARPVPRAVAPRPPSRPPARRSPFRSRSRWPPARAGSPVHRPVRDVTASRGAATSTMLSASSSRRYHGTPASRRSSSHAAHSSRHSARPATGTRRAAARTARPPGRRGRAECRSTAKTTVEPKTKPAAKPYMTPERPPKTAPPKNPPRKERPQS